MCSSGVMPQSYSPVIFLLEAKLKDFPGGSVDKNPLARTGGHGFDSWSEKIACAAGQLSLCARTAEPTRHS